MAAYKPWLTIDAIDIPIPIHPFPRNSQKFFPKYDPDTPLVVTFQLPGQNIQIQISWFLLIRLEN